MTETREFANAADALAWYDARYDGRMCFKARIDAVMESVEECMYAHPQDIYTEIAYHGRRVPLMMSKVGTTGTRFIDTTLPGIKQFNPCPHMYTVDKKMHAFCKEHEYNSGHLDEKGTVTAWSEYRDADDPFYGWTLSYELKPAGPMTTGVNLAVVLSTDAKTPC